MVDLFFGIWFQEYLIGNDLVSRYKITFLHFYNYTTTYVFRTRESFKNKNKIKIKIKITVGHFLKEKVCDLPLNYSKIFNLCFYYIRKTDLVKCFFDKIQKIL